MTKTVIRIDEVQEDGKKNHYKSMTIPRHPLTVWKMLKAGAFQVAGLDLEGIRSERLRPGGKK